MSEEVHKIVDDEIEEVAKRLSSIYKREADELEQKAKTFFDRFEKRDAQKRKLVDDGKMTEKEYANWRQGQMMTGKRWNDLVKQSSRSLMNVSQHAVDIVNGKLPEIYALSYNEVGGDAERKLKGYTFELVNKNTVAYLAKEDRNLLPYKKVGEEKFERWCKQKISGEVMQGILQGESVDKLAKRFREVAGMDRTSSIRNARTTFTSAESKGTLDGMHQLEDDGLIVKKAWLATHDGRTRDSHLHFEAIGAIDLEDEFDTGLMYPADPDGDPAEVYNCRCSLETIIVGYNGKKFDYQYGFERKPVEGKDISETWERRADDFEYEIQDVIDAQGFNGLPRVVSEEEFDKAVRESNFIAQRVYSAPDQETLDSYRNQLYNGEWYVDCSNGGAAFGKGMYAVYDNGIVINEYMEREMNGYRARRGTEHSYTETFTLVPDAKTITPNELIALRREVQEKINVEFKARGGWRSKEAIEWASEHDVGYNRYDDGSFAALMGYDAILTSGIDNYAVILNRTKVIFKGD